MRPVTVIEVKSGMMYFGSNPLGARSPHRIPEESDLIVVDMDSESVSVDSKGPLDVLVVLGRFVQDRLGESTIPLLDK